MSEKDLIAGRGTQVDLQVDLPEDRQREILALERKLDSASLFELLGVDPAADREAIRQAYHRASLKFHPDRYFNQNLGGFRARLERIFRKLSEANSVLTDEVRRQAYLKEHPELRAPGASTPEVDLSPERTAERRSRFAKHPYLARAAKVKELMDLARTAQSRGDPDAALKHLNAAQAIDPNAQGLAQLLAEARKGMDGRRGTEAVARGRELEQQRDWQGALAAYRSALAIDARQAEAARRAAELILRLNGDVQEAKVLALRARELSPRSADALCTAGTVLLAAGDKKAAKRSLEDALERDPDHAEAKAQLKKLRWVF